MSTKGSTPHHRAARHILVAAGPGARREIISRHTQQQAAVEALQTARLLGRFTGDPEAAMLAVIAVLEGRTN